MPGLGDAGTDSLEQNKEVLCCHSIYQKNNGHSKTPHANSHAKKLCLLLRSTINQWNTPLTLLLKLTQRV